MADKKKKNNKIEDYIIIPFFKAVSVNLYNNLIKTTAYYNTIKRETLLRIVFQRFIVAYSYKLSFPLYFTLPNLYLQWPISGANCILLFFFFYFKVIFRAFMGFWDLLI